MVRPHADHVPALVTLFRHQPVYLMLVGGDHRLRLRVVAQLAIRLPALKAYADLRQLPLDLLRIAALPQRLLRRCIAEK